MLFVQCQIYAMRRRREGGGIHKSSDRCWASFRVLKTALGPVMIPGTTGVLSRGAHHLPGERDLYTQNQWRINCILLKPLRGRIPAPGTHPLKEKKKKKDTQSSLKNEWMHACLLTSAECLLCIRHGSTPFNVYTHTHTHTYFIIFLWTWMLSTALGGTERLS